MSHYWITELVGGEKRMLQLADSHLETCSDFFVLFLAMVPLTTRVNLARKRTARFAMLLRRYALRCNVLLWDADVIVLSKTTLANGSSLLSDAPSFKPEVRALLREPTNTLLRCIEKLGALVPKGARGLGSAVQSEDMSVLFLGLVGFSSEGSTILRNCLAAVFDGQCLYTVLVLNPA